MKIEVEDGREQTTHRVFFGSSTSLPMLPDTSVDLIVTSPPYPMIEMWDEVFTRSDPEIQTCLDRIDGRSAFEAMHRQLDSVWKECFRVLKNGSYACINIGDATRKVGDHFRLYSNHARIISAFNKLGFEELPLILWRKQTNAPNKFMGSGMLPAGAYITLEHEYILIFRKGKKKEYTAPEEKQRRMESAYFWEERNTWFSDVWDFKGARQKLEGENIRPRSGAYPFILAYRLINMFSLKWDTILDPFLGRGTTTVAALASCRNSVGIEIDRRFLEEIERMIVEEAPFLNEVITDRLKRHVAAVYEEEEKKPGSCQYSNEFYGFPVKTRQEVGLMFHYIDEISMEGEDGFTGTHRIDSDFNQTDPPRLKGFPNLPERNGQLKFSME